MLTKFICCIIIQNSRIFIFQQTKNFEGLIIKESKVTESFTVPSKAEKTVPVLNVAKDGYIPIGIVGMASIGGCILYNYELHNNEIRSYIYNTTETDKTDYIRFAVLYVKNI